MPSRRLTVEQMTMGLAIPFKIKRSQQMLTLFVCSCLLVFLVTKQSFLQTNFKQMKNSDSIAAVKQYRHEQDLEINSNSTLSRYNSLIDFTKNYGINGSRSFSRQLLSDPEPLFIPYGSSAPSDLEDFPCSFRADDRAGICSVRCGDTTNCESARKWCAVTTECDAIVQVRPDMAVLRRRAPTYEDIQYLKEMLQAGRRKWSSSKLGTDTKRRSYMIASYGGSGSKMLCGLIAMAPSKFVNYIWHIHDPVPPKTKLFAPLKHPRLRRVSIKPHQDFRGVQFMDTDLNQKERMVEIPDGKIDDIRFVFLFRNPIEAMLSRYFYGHCKNLKGDCGATDRQFPNYLKYAKESGDRMRLEEHYDNHISQDNGRQYPIIAINYHRMWDSMGEILDILGLPQNLVKRFPKRVEKRRSTDATIGDATVEELVDLFSVKFSSLIKKVKSMPAVMII